MRKLLRRVSVQRVGAQKRHGMSFDYFIPHYFQARCRGFVSDPQQAHHFAENAYGSVATAIVSTFGAPDEAGHRIFEQILVRHSIHHESGQEILRVCTDKLIGSFEARNVKTIALKASHDSIAVSFCGNQDNCFVPLKPRTRKQADSLYDVLLICVRIHDVTARSRV